MPDIDKLTIEIEASAQKAMPELEKLIRNLDTLQTSLSKISTSSFKKSLSNLGKINLGINTSQTTSLTNLLKTLSTFSFKTVASTFQSASRDFSTVFGAIKDGSSKAITGLKNLITSFSNTKSHSENLITSLGKLYAKILIFKNIGGAITDGIKSSIDYIETYHYFETAIDKVAQGSRELWKQYGADSADAYVDSFLSRAKALNEKMTGYTIDENGYGVSNGLKNLGLDSDILMQYQAQYAQMADSIGMGGESSLATSMALSMIAADWASLRNISFEEAYEKMASGLAGQARGVRSLGIDITQASLQQLLDEMGLEESIQELSQTEKAQLRVIAILKQSKVAWGDLAETINTPANQIRVLEENMKSLGRTIGNIFMPIVAAVLPYLNAFALSLRRGFEWIGAMLGIDVSKYVTSSGGSDFDLGDYGDFGGDAADMLTDGNVWDSGGSGIGNGVIDKALLDAFGEYESVWNAEFDSMTSKAQETSDKINEVASSIYKAFSEKDWESIGNYFSNGINGGLGKVYDYIKDNQIVTKVATFVGDIAKSLNSIIDKVDFGMIGSNLGAGLNDIISVFSTWYDTFNAENFGSKIAELINGFFSEVDWEQLGKYVGSKFQITWDTLAGLIPNLDGKKIGESIATFLNGVIDAVSFESIGKTLAAGMDKAIDALRLFVKNFDPENNLARDFGEGINKFINEIDWKRSGQTLGLFVDKLFAEFVTGFNRINWTNLATDVSNSLYTFITTIKWDKRAGELSNGFNHVISGIKTGIDGIDSGDLGQRLATAVNTIFETVDWEELGALAVAPFNKVKKFINGFVSDEDFFKKAGASLAEFLNGIFTIDLTTASDNLAKAFNGIFTAIGAFIDGTDERAGFDWDALRRNLTGAINTFIWKVDLSSAGSKMQSLFKNMLNTLKDILGEVDWKTLGTKVGEFLRDQPWLEYFTTAFDTISEALKELFKGVFAGVFGDFGEGFADGFVTGVQKIIGLGAELVSGIAEALKKLAEALNKLDPDLVKNLGYALGTFFGVKIGLGFLTNLGQLVIHLTNLKPLVASSGTGTLIGGLNLLSGAFSELGIAVGTALAVNEFMSHDVGASEVGMSSNLLDEFANSIEKIGEKAGLSQEQMEGLRKKVEELRTEAEQNNYTGVVQGVADALGDCGVKASDLTDEIAPLASEMGSVKTAMENAKTSTSHYKEQVILARDETVDLQIKVWDFGEHLGTPMDNVEKLSDAIWKIGNQSDFSATETGNLSRAFNNNLGTFKTVEDAFKFISEKVETMGGNAGIAAQVFRDVFPQALVPAKEALSPLKEKMEGWNTAVSNSPSFLDNMKSALGRVSFADFISGAGKGEEKAKGLDSIVDSFANASVWRIIKMAVYGTTAETAGEKFKNAGTDVESMGDSFDNLDRKISDKKASFKENAKEAGKAIPEGLKEGIEDVQTMQRVSNAMRNVYEEGVMGTGRALMGIHSPSTVMRDDFGKPINEGLANGITDYMYLVKNAVSGWKDAITSPFSAWGEISRDISNAGQSVSSALASGIENSAYLISNAVLTLKNNLTQPFWNIWSEMRVYGQQAANGFADGMKWTHIPVPHVYVASWTTNWVGNAPFYTPNFGVQWYAKGGLFTTPTLAGFGEAGDEAALPLTNKGVMSKIADSIVSASDGFGGMSREDMIEAVATGVAMAMSQNPQTIEVVVNSTLKTNDEKLAQSVERGRAKLNSRYSPTIGYAF